MSRGALLVGLSPIGRTLKDRVHTQIGSRPKESPEHDKIFREVSLSSIFLGFP